MKSGFATANPAGIAVALDFCVVTAFRNFIRNHKTERRSSVAKREAVTMDEHYDLVSVLYHALQGDETLGQYIDDAEGAGDEDLADHFRDIQEKYREIAQETKELLREKLVSGEEEEDAEDK
jgi:hypothetical protein